MKTDVTAEKVYLFASTYLTVRPVSNNKKALLKMNTIRSNLAALSDLYATQRREKGHDVAEKELWTKDLKDLLVTAEQSRLQIMDRGAHDFADAYVRLIFGA